MDVQIIEDGNGGELQIIGNDVVVVYGVENMPYLGMFGGASFWANNLLFQVPDLMFTAETEEIINSTPLNSAGRIIIENAIKRDLQFLLTDVPGTELIVVTKITSDNKLEIRVDFGGAVFYRLWDPTEKVTQSFTTVDTYTTEDELDVYTTQDGDILIPEN